MDQIEKLHIHTISRSGSRKFLANHYKRLRFTKNERSDFVEVSKVPFWSFFYSKKHIRPLFKASLGRANNRGGHICFISKYNIHSKYTYSQIGKNLIRKKKIDQNYFFQKGDPHSLTISGFLFRQKNPEIKASKFFIFSEQ